MKKAQKVMMKMIVQQGWENLEYEKQEQDHQKMKMFSEKLKKWLTKP